MANLTIYHNNRCSKSRDAMCILDEIKMKADVIEYLINPPTEDEIKDILKKLGMKASEIIRKGETVYKEKFADKKMSEDQWIKALIKYPILMERPIVVRGNKAVIARPAEKLRELFR
ncbi:MAG TPA: arsenate reductase (glutaredoxin) [Bacteroidia bacterium]|jgi:arsenate reductase|nr:arsenate reductase (glutaredoxin) [Bacteroidia bacterium]